MRFFGKDEEPVNTLLTDGDQLYRKRDNDTWWSSDGLGAPTGDLREATQDDVKRNQRYQGRHKK